MACIVNFQKLFILYFEIVAHNENILVEFPFSMFFTLVISSYFHTSNSGYNDNWSSILERISQFPNGICVKKIGTNLGWKFGVDEIMVVNSIVMTICMSHLSEPLLILIQYQRFSTFTIYAFLQKLFMHFYVKWFHSQSDCCQSLPYLANHNASIHSLNFLWSYLQFNQSYHTCWTPLLQMQHFYF